MKKVLASAALIWLIGLGACNKEISPAEQIADNPKLVAFIGKQKSKILLKDVAKLRANLVKAHSGEVQGLERVNVYLNDKGIYVLEYAGPTKDGKYRTYGRALVYDESTGAILMSGQCTQTCTSSSDCRGCALTIHSDCSGSCHCNSGGGGSTHTVSTGKTLD